MNLFCGLSVPSICWCLAFLVGLFYTCVIPTHGSQVFTRQANTTLTLPPSPEAGSYSYSYNDPVRDLSFDQPVAIRSLPGETNRMFIVERVGRIIVITNLAFATK